jgi:hypothetical protein
MRNVKISYPQLSIIDTIFIPPLPGGGRGVYCFTSVLLSVQYIFRRIFLSNYQWQKSDIWLQASYRYAILWVAVLDPSDSYFLFADLVGFYTHWTCMHIFRHIFLSNYWWLILSWEYFYIPKPKYFVNNTKPRIFLHS